MNIETADLPGTKIHVRCYGDPKNPAVIALHSLFLNGEMFDKWATSVQESLFVVVPDFRGQGKSPNTDGRFILTMEDYVDDLELLVPELQSRFGFSTFGVLAQSMGGDVALRFAIQNSRKMTKLALLGSSACQEPPDQLKDFRSWVEGVSEHGFIDDELEYTLRVMMGLTCRSDPGRAEIVEDMRAELGLLTSDLLPAMRGVVERKGILDSIHLVTQEVLIISGLEDWARPPQWSIDMDIRIPNSTLLRLSDVGHSPIIEALETVGPILRDFFQASVN